MVEFIVNPKTMFEYVRNGKASQIRRIINTCQDIYNEYQYECKREEIDKGDVKPLVDKYILSGEKKLVEKLCDLYFDIFISGIPNFDEECYEFIGDFIMEFAILTNNEKRIIREKIEELQKRLDELEK